MNRFLTFFSCAAITVAAAAPAAPPEPDLMARIHFAGAGQISADTNAVAFTNLWCSPEALALRGQTLDKLSRGPFAWFKSKVPPGAGDGAAQLRPLLDDLTRAEWFLRIRDATNGSPEYALAIRLDAARAQLWSTNLAAILQAWTRIPAVQDESGGWEFKKHLPPNLFRFARVGDWVVLGWGQDELPVNKELIRRVTAEKRPAPAETNAWVTADLDWPRLARWFPALKPVDLPRTQLRFAGRDRNLHLDGKLTFPQPLALTLEPWRVPTNTIRQPIASFTAVRGLAAWLNKQDWAQPYEISPAPNQAFIWAMGQMPLQTFAAVPVPDGQKAVNEFFQKLSTHTNWQSPFLTPITMMLTNGRISWGGMPFISPNLRTVREPSGDFLAGEFFPNGPKPKQPLPPELFQELGRSNVLCYHWENTPLRLKQLPQLMQLGLMLTRHRQLDANSAANKWLAAIGPTLGNSVTEVTQTAPDQLAFSRTGSSGLTAFELIVFANWLEAANFPGCDLRLPPPKLRRPLPRKPGAPPAQSSGGPPPFILH